MEGRGRAAAAAAAVARVVEVASLGGLVERGVALSHFPRSLCINAQRVVSCPQEPGRRDREPLTPLLGVPCRYMLEDENKEFVRTKKETDLMASSQSHTSPRCQARRKEMHFSSDFFGM